jgi:hypothetical protein
MTQDLIHCRRCDARFDPQTKFVRGYRPEPLNTKTGTFIATSVVEPGHCPVCNKRPGTGPRERQEAM